MLMRKFAATSALLIAAMGVTAGTVNAAPAEEAAPINYTAEVVDGSKSIITIDSGSLVAEDGQFKIKAADGKTVAATALTYQIDDFQLPILADISGKSATLTPVVDPAQAVYKPVALPYQNVAPWKTEYEREQAAWSRLTSTISMGATVGTLVGGLTGAAIGCVAGALAGTVVTAALATLFGAGPVVGCIAGAGAVGFIGVLIGQIFVTGPVAIAAAVQYFSTINQPFTPPAK
ncbi:hypothetical protein [Nocardia sp. NPDC058666]|uniref:hypothetical protein n=1 Tax=unclassified Nocardia TaxID=2637762 RepID=UPI0036611DAC